MKNKIEYKTYGKNIIDKTLHKILKEQCKQIKKEILKAERKQFKK